MSTATGQPAAELDHLVIVAATLDEGVRWCEATFGVALAAGGEHPLMGTHNRLLGIAGPGFPRAYLEVIAVHPTLAPTRPAPARRWFDMDDPALQARVARDGPQLAHLVARVSDMAAARAALAAIGIDRGPALAASRQTPRGLLQWQITVREDGQRLFGGALPTLIHWGEGAHPSDNLAGSGVALQLLHLTHPDAPALQAALAALQLALPVTAGPEGVHARFATPRGPLALGTAA